MDSKRSSNNGISYSKLFNLESLMNFQLPQQDDDFDYYGNSSQDESRGSQGGAMADRVNGTMSERHLSLSKKKRRSHFQSANSDDEEGGNYGTHISEEWYRSMLGEHVQKYKRRFKDSSASPASNRIGIPVPRSSLSSKSKKVETVSEWLNDTSPQKLANYNEAEYPPDYSSNRTPYEFVYLDIGNGISYRIPPTYDKMAASLNLPSFSDIRVEEFYLKGTLDLGSLAAMMATDKRFEPKSRAGMGDPFSQYESLQEKLKALSASNSAQKFSLKVTESGLTSCIPEGAAGNIPRSILSEGGVLQVYYVKVLEKGDTYEIIERSLPKKPKVKKDPAAIEREEMEKVGRFWVNIVRRDIPKHHRSFTTFHRKQLIDAKRFSENCQREVKLKVSRSLKLMRGASIRTRKLARGPGPLDSSVTMVTICQKCGDKGFDVALIYCDKCQVVAEHRYCLDILPATFTEYVTWFCEDCAPKIVKPSLDKAIPAPFRRNDRLAKSAKVFLARKRVKRSIEAIAALKRKSMSGSVTTTEVRRHEYSHLQPYEARRRNYKRDQKLEKQRRLMLIDDVNTDEKGESSKLFQDQNLKEAESGKINNNQMIGEAASSKIDQNQKLEESESSKISNEQKLEEVETNKISENPKFDEAESNEISLDLKLEKQCRSVSEDKGNTDQEAESSKINTNDDRANTLEQNFGDPAQPIVDPVWRGRFSTCDTKFTSMDGLAAHLSTKACLKVRDEARMLPNLIFLDIIPRDDVWPKSFRSSEPGDDNIALYFFPENEKDERVYDSLVEYMIEEDLAMRAMAVNAELLVFTSIQLPLGYWRFQAKYYLWGVFRRKQEEGHLVVHSTSNKSTVTALPVDVETDLRKTLFWDIQSPISPLNNGSYG